MANRNKVFQSKVLQKLYSLPPKSEKEPSPPPILETIPKKPKLQEEAREGTAVGDGGTIPGQAQMGRRVYTVLPPPGDYQTGAGISVTLSQPAGMNTPEDPADENSHQSSEEKEEQADEEQKRRRRRRKKRKSNTTPGECAGKEGTGQAGESNTDPPSVDQTSEGNGERLSKNKRRKMKKKRHREKLVSMGLAPRAAALEFTYQRERDVEEEEEEEEEVLQRRSAEVAEFLRTTLDLYASDCSVAAERPQVPPTALEDLLTRISSGTAPPSVLSQLHTLKALVQLKDTARLAKALEEFQHISLDPEETTAVVSLVQYWITDVLTLEGDTNITPS